MGILADGCGAEMNNKWNSRAVVVSGEGF